jgi:ribosome-binding protein aMBF1 (putative translation factor)
MKVHPTKKSSYINVKVGMSGGKEISYHIPSSARQKLDSFLKELDMPKSEIIPWEEATPWEALAKDRIDKYKKAGLVLRGARLREGLSQKELARLSGVSQDNISRIENGKRVVGKKVARKLAKPLKINYSLLIEDDASA